MTVQIENRDNGIQIVRLTGASASKSFSRESLPIIADAIDKGLKNPDIKGMVITGEGKFFSAGADINAFQESIEANEAPQLIRDLTNILHPLLMRIRESSTIVVAAINGAAAGGGLGLALACDARIASPKAKLAASYASIGLSPDGGTTWLLPRLVGEQRSRQFFFENQIWNAEESANAGAIDEVVNEDELINRSIEIATNWSQWGNHFREATKHLLHVQTLNDFETWEIVPKQIPRRNILPGDMIQNLIDAVSNATSEDQNHTNLGKAIRTVIEGVANHFFENEGIQQPKFSKFQVDSVKQSLLDALGFGGKGSILVAGVGSGKTLAFMLTPLILCKRDILDGKNDYGAHFIPVSSQSPCSRSIFQISPSIRYRCWYTNPASPL